MKILAVCGFVVARIAVVAVIAVIAVIATFPALWCVFVVGKFIGHAFGARRGFARTCGECDAFSWDVDLKYAHSELLSNLDNIVGIFDVLVGEFGDMDETVLMDADIDEGTEGRDVGDDAFELHTDGEIFDLVDIFTELRSFKGGARVTSGLFEFVDDIAQGGFADIIAEVAFDLDLLDQGDVADQRADIYAKIGGHLFDERITFGVNGGGIKGVLASANTEKSSGLFEGFGPKTRHFEQGFAIRERAVLFAMFDDLFREGGADACDIREEGSAGGVDFDANLVHAAFHDFIELFLEEGLINIVLVLSNADGFGIDFDEFSERILEASGDGDGSTDGEVEIGEFFAGNIRGAVHTCARFVDLNEDDIADTLGFQGFFEEGFGFSAPCAISDSDSVGWVLGEEGEQVACCACFVTDGEKEGGISEKLSCLIDGNAFAACAESGVDADHTFFAEGRGEQEIAEVVGKDIDGVAVGAHLDFDAHVGFDARCEQTLVGILDGEGELFGKGGRSVVCGFVLDIVEYRIGVDLKGCAECAFFFAALDGEKAVGRDGFEGFFEVVVLFKLAGLLFEFGGGFGDQDAFLKEAFADKGADIGFFGKDLGNDIACAKQGFVGGGNFFGGVDKGGGFGFGITDGGLCKDTLCERRQPAFARDDGAGAAFGFEGEVKVFEFGFVVDGEEAGAQLVGEFALFGDGSEDGLSALFEFFEVVVSFLDGADLDFIEGLRGFFAVACDERDGVSVFEEPKGGDNALERELGFGNKERNGIKSSALGHGCTLCLAWFVGVGCEGTGMIGWGVAC